MRIGQFSIYKNFKGSIEYDPEDNIYHGKILDIRALVNYQGDSIIELEKNYHNAVDDYIILLKGVVGRNDFKS